MSLSGRPQAHPLTQEFHGPLQARVRRHPTNGTVRVRRRASKRRQHSHKLSAPKRQPKRPRGQIPPRPRQRARARAPTFKQSLHRRTRTPVAPSEDACRTTESIGADSPRSQTKPRALNSSRRLFPLSDLLTVKLRGRAPTPVGAEGAQFPSARGA